MKTKTKTPLALRAIPAVFPWIERVLPGLANRFFIHLFFTPIAYTVPDKEKKAESFAEKFTLDVADRKIQCYKWGNSTKTVLAVHGWAGRGTQFRRFVKPFITAGYQFIAFDGPAHGKSQGRSTDLDQFKAVIETLVAKTGTVSAIVAHSFGGVASLYALSKGLPVKKLVNIASPTIGDEIINTYRRAIGASVKTGEAFKQYVIKKSGKSFDEFSALEIVKNVPAHLNLLLVHDLEDKEVAISHPQELVKRFPGAKLHQTSGLGHTRILKDSAVIAVIVTFVTSDSSDSQ